MRLPLLVSATLVACAPSAPPMAPSAAPSVEIPLAEETPPSPAPTAVAQMNTMGDDAEPNASAEVAAPCDDECEESIAGGLGLRGGEGVGTEGTIGIGGLGPTGHGTGTFDRRGNGTAGDAVATKSGRLDKDEIRRVIQAHLGRVRQCYEQSLVREPTRKGKMTMEFVIGTDGAVTGTNVVSSDVGDSNLEGCVTDVFDKMAFPKPEGGVVNVRYPLVFSPTS